MCGNGFIFFEKASGNSLRFLKKYLLLGRIEVMEVKIVLNMFATIFGHLWS
jgi:hypothetical protein